MYIYKLQMLSDIYIYIYNIYILYILYYINITDKYINIRINIT